MEAIADMMKEKEREKEMQLESLRELVRIEAPRDPGRAMKDTAVSDTCRYCTIVIRPLYNVAFIRYRTCRTGFNCVVKDIIEARL